MRILVVSAHYPPNFVSGGTLAPQRIAQQLAARGHEVGVFAGWLGDDRAPLECWTEPDDRGVPVTWIVVTPWTAWGADENYDNPAVTARFAEHLADMRPDVVHFHALQTLGTGLLGVAAESGAATVVTLHDFWWVCARLFLVDRSLRPCCPVVDCGTCECERGREWLDARTSLLRRRVARADAVLAVSRSHAELLEANGISPGRVLVDENGVPSEEVTAHRPPETGAPTDGQPVARDVCFLYMGGSEPVKGVHVVFDAARRLADLDGWRLIAVDVERYLAEEPGGVAALPIERRARFEPTELAELLQEADALVVPSVARESYSLVTREALSHGVPVIVSDVPGPAEVVIEGRNGLIVPAGDAAALAAAMRRVVVEPALLATLRAGTGADGGVHVRTVGEQVSWLEALYRDLLAARRARETGARASLTTKATAGVRRGPPSAARRAVRRVLFLTGIQGAPLRYRAQLPAEALALRGVASEIRHYRDPLVPVLAAGADALVVYRVPATPQVLGVIEAARLRGTPVHFDADDLIFDPDVLGEVRALDVLDEAERALYVEGVRRYRTTLEACDAYIGSTDALCRHVENVVGLPAHRVANGVGLLAARRSERELARPRRPGPFRLGYLSGTKTHDHDWRAIEPAVASFLARHHEAELWLVGLVTPSAALDAAGGRVRRLPLQHWSSLPAILRDLDVNLAPLESLSRFNEAKSAIKWLEAALTATPTIASPTEAFREAIDDGVTGALATEAAEWEAWLERLAGDEVARAAMGERARTAALVRWSPHLQGERYRTILEADLPARTRHAWSPVANDEPWEPTPVDAYVDLGAEPEGLDHLDPAAEAHAAPPGGPAPPATSRRERAGALARRGARSLREDGVASAARRGARVVRRQWPKVERRLRAAAGELRGPPPREP